MLHTSNIAVATALALAGFFACGCASRGPRSPQPTTSEVQPMGAPCDGQRYVEVHNAFGTAADVYGYPAGGGASQYLGSVGSGTQRLPLSVGMGFIYAEMGGRRATGRAASRGAPSSISFTRGCAPRD